MPREEVKEKRYTFRMTVDITEDGDGEPILFHECPAVWYRCKYEDVLLLEGELIEMLRRLNQHGIDRLQDRGGCATGGSGHGGP